jgi:hypothetical protein
LLLSLLCCWCECLGLLDSCPGRVSSSSSSGLLDSVAGGEEEETRSNSRGWEEERRGGGGGHASWWRDAVPEAFMLRESESKSERARESERERNRWRSTLALFDGGGVDGRSGVAARHDGDNPPHRCCPSCPSPVASLVSLSLSLSLSLSHARSLSLPCLSCRVQVCGEV